MKTRALRTAAVTAALAGLAAGCGSSESDDGGTVVQAAQGATVKRELVIRPSSFGRLEQGKRGEDGGDQFFFVQGLTDSAKEKKVTQRAQAVCTRAAPGEGEVYQCMLSIVLTDGGLFAMGTGSQQGLRSGAIVGGSGKYLRSTGTFEYQSKGGEVRLVLNITR